MNDAKSMKDSVEPLSASLTQFNASATSSALRVARFASTFWIMRGMESLFATGTFS